MPSWHAHGTIEKKMVGVPPFWTPSRGNRPKSPKVQSDSNSGYLSLFPGVPRGTYRCFLEYPGAVTDGGPPEDSLHSPRTRREAIQGSSTTQPNGTDYSIEYYSKHWGGSQGTTPRLLPVTTGYYGLRCIYFGNRKHISETEKIFRKP